MLRDSQLWMKIGRICTLLAKRLDISPERAFDIFQMSKTNELLHDERSLLYLMSDLYIVDDVVMELQSADGAQLNLDALYQIAPSCFTEVADTDTGGGKTCS